MRTWSWCWARTPLPPDRSDTDRLAPFLAAPERSAILFDYDGTLSPIVDDPEAAVPAAGAFEVLEGLARRFHTVAAISGRPVDFLARMLPASLVLSGVYGLESRRDGVRSDRPEAATWRRRVDDAVADAEADGPIGMRIERKGASLTVHYRGRPDLAPAVWAWAEAVAARTGLVPRGAKQSVELHPPLGIDKGTAAAELADGLDAVLYAGDDVGDLLAFDALDRIEAEGRAVARIAVAGSEPTPDLLARADLVLDAPEDLVALLRTL